jgi:tRNA A-37 threonylcarbamoyl transferase component Bud32
MLTPFRKDVSDRSSRIVKKEVEFQERAAALGLAPRILETDCLTYIVMENLDQMSVADMYGDKFEAMPEWIVREIYAIILRLYLECDIAYIDVTPYNFIEKDGKIWVIDFGDALYAPEKDDWLMETFRRQAVTRWNPEFL